MGLRAEELEQLDHIVKHPPALSPKENLYRRGTRLRAIYAVRSGSLKTFSEPVDGREQVIGFHLPGELVGLDAIMGGTYACTAEALEHTSVCEIPYDRLEAVSQAIPSLQRQLIRLMGKEILSNEQHLLLLGQKNADQRVATLIVSLAVRLGSRDVPASEFRLSMPRADIGSYLGLAHETVTRCFRRLRGLGFIDVEQRFVRIRQLDALKRIAAGLDENERGISLQGLC